MRELPQQEKRVETGATKFGDDWTGVFIRGDNAFHYAISLASCIQTLERLHYNPLEVVALRGLVRLLESSNEFN